MGALLRALGACDFGALIRQRVVLRLTWAVVRKKGDLEQFCSEKKLRCKAVQEAMKLRDQLLQKRERAFSITASFDGLADQEFADEDGVDDELAAQQSVPAQKPPTPQQMDGIRQIILAGSGDRVAMWVSSTTPPQHHTLQAEARAQ